MKIVKRKKGNNYYFYLQHSFRKNGKVIAKERYLGKKIPRNIEKTEQELFNEARSSIYSLLDKIKKNFQREWESYPVSIKEKQKEEIAIAFTYNTNAIEGSTITLDETREIIQDKIAPNKPLKDIKETEMHYLVFLGMLNKKERISNKILLAWHNEIFKDTKKDIAGRYRDYLVRVGNYIAPNWQDINRLMNQLILFINNARMNPVELALRAHYKFERIHPFGDGNGRIGRLMMNSMLWHAGYPMLIIEYKKRRAYYRALEKGEEGFTDYYLRKYLAINKKRV